MQTTYVKNFIPLTDSEQPTSGLQKVFKYKNLIVFPFSLILLKMLE